MLRLLKVINKSEDRESTGSPEVGFAHYTVNYPALNSRLFKNDRRTYDLCIIHVHAKECGLGFKVLEIGKPHLIGTRVHYEALQGPVDFNAYQDVLQALITKFNETYKEDLSYDCI